MNDPAKQQQVQHDGQLTIAVGKSRKEMHWKNKQLLWSDLVARLRKTAVTGETHSDYMKLSKPQQDAVKDRGGFVGGTLKSGRRKSGQVAFRSLLTLDADFIKGDLWDMVEIALDCAIVAYSTHKHTPARPRLRLIIPLSRPVTADEYQPLARKIAEDLGIDFFDDTTYEAERLMYWPSSPSDVPYFFRFQDTAWLDPDSVLARYPDWKDPSYWPESSRQKQQRQKLADKQGNPLEKPGMVGAFCRAYTITEALETFLPDVYAPAAGAHRYTYTAGSTTGGMIVYDDDLFAYSHHGTDPMGGQLVNAFDLVRIHKFHDLDDDAEFGTPTVKLPSYSAMIDFARQDGKVKETNIKERLAEASEDFKDNSDWIKRLDQNKDGSFDKSVKNIKIILRNDENLAGKFALNDFTHRQELIDDLPWRKRSRGVAWKDSDDACLRNYLSDIYGISHKQNVADAVDEVNQDNAFHPVRDYLNGLEWDGTPRLDTILIDYLSADDTPYVRAVTRKMLIAAVGRIMKPGIKFDQILVLVGPQGAKKSYFIRRLGHGWTSDSLDTIKGKDAYEQLQGTWLIELAELKATRRAETEAVKHFTAKQVDRFRVSYGHHVEEFPRQCVFFGTTNISMFLIDKTGNRRWWPVTIKKCAHKKDVWNDLKGDELDQIWAEAKHAWDQHESLLLSPELEKAAQAMQEAHLEEDDKFGLVEEYLNTNTPASWDDWELGQRRAWLSENPSIREKGVNIRDKTCAMEIWAECFGNRPEDMNPMRSREISDILENISGWVPYDKNRGRMKFKIYGKQKAYVLEDQQ
ncbi:virulence-associated E family protein [Sporolactobacillus sp. CQH2019]|uniref:virulence-associated E family protein n=1 Tax=Sporolactobacillus sp. CQH2019 TaxID=3023512 RepID=UPI002368E29D|nr:virulence-associated E family protein [Sporolactobacillus sp. CQH2019]MDD9148145.1 virulence-associated E family protein [Sporolactobacillus sp. CQH2019]